MDLSSRKREFGNLVEAEYERVQQQARGQKKPSRGVPHREVPSSTAEADRCIRILRKLKQPLPRHYKTMSNIDLENAVRSKVLSLLGTLHPKPGFKKRFLQQQDMVDVDSSNIMDGPRSRVVAGRSGLFT